MRIVNLTPFAINFTNKYGDIRTIRLFTETNDDVNIIVPITQTSSNSIIKLPEEAKSKKVAYITSGFAPQGYGYCFDVYFSNETNQDDPARFVSGKSIGRITGQWPM